ncbi:MAG: PLP-dependent transferase [Planctomycetes bacterium]|nr:PLP-dependent transferase [Planctomycetota bacterium]
MPKKRTDQFTRRGALQAGAGMAIGSVLGTDVLAVPVSVNVDVYTSLGVKHVINAGGTFTNLGGSVMPPEVVAAWVEASKHFINLSDLITKVGERIAKLIGVEAALVTTGAAGALQLATAAAITQGDPKLIARLPDTTGLRNEVIIQKSHHSSYDIQMAAAGGKLIQVETLADAKKAINDRTALMFFMNHAEPSGKIKRAEFVAMAREHKIPTLIDAAADAPPVERLTEYLKMGFDLAAFSGGKAIRGPNDTGLLLGKKSLIEAAKKNTNPNASIGRALKVGKEDMIALLAAVERFVTMDHAAEEREWERRIAFIEKTLKDIPTLKTERITPAIANHVPHVIITWDPKKVKITPEQVNKELAAGDPPIVIARVHGTGDHGILISVFVLQEGEDRIVAERLHGLLAKASG